MPIVSSVGRADPAIQADGTRYLQFEFTDQNGKQYQRGYGKYPVAVDPEVQKLTFIPQLDLDILAEEKEWAWQIGVSGGDIDVLTYLHHTTADIQQWWWRRFMNLYREESTDQDVVNRIEYAIIASEPLLYVNKNGNNVISGFIDDPAWGVNTVNSSLSAIKAVGIAAGQMFHTEAELPL